MNYGVVGLGFVGSAVDNGFMKTSKYLYDLNKKILKGKPSDADIIFLCLPTPTQNGVQNIDTIVSTMENLVKEKYDGIVVVKSTVLPGTCKYLSNRFPELRIVHNPEFLNQRTANEDFLNQKYILLGGYLEDCEIVRELYLSRFDNLSFHIGIPKETEWAKYIHNCVLPIKLSFLNEVYREVNNRQMFNDIIEMAEKFGNLGSNNKVPGADGLGWSGACFPKDTSALFKQYPNLKTLGAAIETNNEIRQNL